MKLATKTRYAVRAVFDIAYHGRGRATQARDISRRQDVPLRYLEQILQELKRGKLVEGKRGPNGGYSLTRQPETITIGDVVRAMQGPIELLMDDSSPDVAPGDQNDNAGALVSSVAAQNRLQDQTQNREVSATIWKELAQKIGACFDDVSVRDLCLRGEAIGLHRGDPQSRHMYFI